MEEQGRGSRASSIVMVSSATDKIEKKLQSFCKRSRSVQRDPNCAVEMRGWLYKRDSTGLKLWKRRWFVLSNYCLFYYKDSREECVLGSLPLPSYKIFFCSPRECKNRKYAFKVVHQGMRAYLFSADTQEDMLGWVRALRQSACMESDDLINRRCSSYHDFSQLGGSTDSVNALYVYDLSHHTVGGVDMLDHRGKYTAAHSFDMRARSLSLEHTADHALCQGSGPSTPKSQYGSGSHSPVGRAELRLQDIYSDPLPPLPHSRLTHNPSGRQHENTSSVHVFPPSECEKGKHTFTALQKDTDMVLTCLCGCDKVLQTLSVELDLLQQDKEHAEFALDISRIDLGRVQLNKQHISQKALLQEEVVTIRARICNVSQEMERVWLDYKRMESELYVFHSHLQHICQFGFPQERSLAQKQIWMMDDILSGLKPNRSRFQALMVLHSTTMFPLLHKSSIYPKESVPYWGEESEPPARPPLPLELDSRYERPKQKELAESKYTNQLVLNPASMKFRSSTHTDTHTHTSESQSLFRGEESDLSEQMKFYQKKMHKRNRSSDNPRNQSDKLFPLSESLPVCVTHVMKTELPSALSAQRVCVKDENHEEETLDTQNYKYEEQIDCDTVDACTVNKKSELFRKCDKRQNNLKRVERIGVLKSALRRSDSAHPLKLLDVLESGQRSTDSEYTGTKGVHDNAPEAYSSLSDIKSSSANHISTLTINNTQSEEDKSVNYFTSTNQRAEWFFSTNHWQEFIPLNIQEEEISPTNQHPDTSTNQHPDTTNQQPNTPTNHHSATSTNLHSARPINQQPDSLTNQQSGMLTKHESCMLSSKQSATSTNQTHFSGKLTVTPSLFTMKTLDENIPKLSGPLSHQPLGTSPDSHMIFHSDHSGRELCIYEEIQYDAPKSSIEDLESVVGEAKAQEAHFPTSQNADSHQSVNQCTLIVVGAEDNGAMGEVEAVKETGNEVNTKIQQPVYSWSKKSVTNRSASSFKPRVTVVSTRL